MAPHLYRVGCFLDLAPRNRFIWTGTSIRSIKLLRRVNVNAVVGTIPLQQYQMLNDDLFLN